MSDAERAVGALLALMARLRDPERGCPWDRAQSFSSIAPYTIEEAYEVADAIEHGDREHLLEELGDLLFSVVNWSRHLHIDAEAALRVANDKFERRFARMESLVQARGLELARLSPAEWEALWNEAKLNAS